MIVRCLLLPLNSPDKILEVLDKVSIIIFSTLILICVDFIDIQSADFESFQLSLDDIKF